MSDILFSIKDYLEKCLKTPVYINPDEGYLRVIYKDFPVCKILKQERGGFSIEFAREFTFDDYPTITWRSTLSGVENCISSRIGYYDIKKGQKDMTKLKELRDYLLENVGYNINTEIDNYDTLTIYEARRTVCYIKEVDGGFHIQYLHPYLFDGWSESVYAVNNSLVNDSIRNRIIRYNKDNTRIEVNVDNNTVNKVMYMMARGSGKTRFVADLLKRANIDFKDNIKDVIFNDPATIVFWTDGSKTVVKCEKGETFDPEKGLAMAISKKVLGNDYGYYETFAKYVGRYNKKNRKKYIKAIDDVLSEIAPDEIVRDGVVYKRVEEK